MCFYSFFDQKKLKKDKKVVKKVKICKNFIKFYKNL